jgi:hypothetical protein
MPWFGWLASIVSGRRCARRSWRSLRSAAAAQRRVRRPRRAVGDRAEGHRHNHQPLLHVAGAPAPCHACAGAGPTPLTTAPRRSLPHPPDALADAIVALLRVGAGEGEVACARTCGEGREGVCAPFILRALQVPGKHQGFVHIKTCPLSDLPHTPPCIRNCVRVHCARARFPFVRLPVTSSR